MTVGHPDVSAEDWEKIIAKGLCHLLFIRPFYLTVYVGIPVAGLSVMGSVVNQDLFE